MIDNLAGLAGLLIMGIVLGFGILVGIQVGFWAVTKFHEVRVWIFGPPLLLIMFVGCRGLLNPDPPEVEGEWLCPGTWAYEHELDENRVLVLTDSTCTVSRDRIPG